MTTKLNEPVRHLRGATIPAERPNHYFTALFPASWDMPATLTEERRSGLGALPLAGNAMTRAIRGSLRWRPSLQDGAEILLLALTLPLYSLVRGQATERADEAIRRGGDVVALEKRLGIFWHPALQRAPLGHGWLIDRLTAFYLYGHLPLIGALAVWLYFRH